MADETKIEAETEAGKAKAASEAGTAAVEKAAKAADEGAKAPAAASAKTGKRSAKAARKAAGKTKARSNSKRRPNRSAPEAKPVSEDERMNDVNFDPTKIFAGFGAFPGAPFQSLFAEAGERSQEAVRRSQETAEELADLTRANVEAVVDAGRIAAEGARSLGQDVVESSRESIEQAADAVRLLAEAKSATEFVQLQGEFARSSFDRMVAESSRLTENMVKLAGEAFQPISNRAALNAERINQIVA